MIKQAYSMVGLYRGVTRGQQHRQLLGLRKKGKEKRAKRSLSVLCKIKIWYLLWLCFCILSGLLTCKNGRVIKQIVLTLRIIHIVGPYAPQISKHRVTFHEIFERFYCRPFRKILRTPLGLYNCTLYMLQAYCNIQYTRGTCIIAQLGLFRPNQFNQSNSYFRSNVATIGGQLEINFFVMKNIRTFYSHFE